MYTIRVGRNTEGVSALFPTAAGSFLEKEIYGFPEGDPVSCVVQVHDEGYCACFRHLEGYILKKPDKNMLVDSNGESFYMHKTNAGCMLIPFKSELEPAKDIYAKQQSGMPNFYAQHDNKRLLAYVKTHSFHIPLEVPSIPLAFYHDGEMYLVTQENSGIVMQHGKIEIITFMNNRIKRIV